MDKIKFSILLEYLIKNSSYTIKRLAEETNIDRTVLQNISLELDFLTAIQTLKNSRQADITKRTARFSL